MEIYANSSATDRQVLIEFPDTPVSMDVFIDDDGTVTEIQTLVAVPGEGYTFTLPLRLAQEDRTLKVTSVITFEEDGGLHTIEKRMTIDVVTPILSKREIKAVWDTATPQEVVTIEKAVRNIIQAHTGQQFGLYTGTLGVKGQGSRSLMLPRRLVSLDAVNGADAKYNYEVDSSGYIVTHYPWGVPPVKADYYGLHQHVGGVIHNPNNVRLGVFEDGRQFNLTGKWGWPQVPEQVKEAAKLLVNDYACADSQYRDRYLVSMTAADWRIQFNAGAYVRTGNVRADQLLAEYVVLHSGWGVI